MTEYKWKVQCYYKDRPGVLAFEALIATDFQKEMEVAAANKNEKIGKVVVTEIGKW